jgi:ABC-type transport system involved in cytochrome bd biosynthesis fused ATPase/permease subunit
MKIKSLVKKGAMLIAVMLFTLSFSQVEAQNKKVDKAEAKFCTSLVNFVQSLENLLEANEGTDIEAFNKAYKSSDKSWNKLVKSADKLEAVDIKEVVKAYNDIVDQVNKIANNTKSSENTEKIAKHINNSLATFQQISGSVCD